MRDRFHSPRTLHCTSDFELAVQQTLERFGASCTVVATVLVSHEGYLLPRNCSRRPVLGQPSPVCSPLSGGIVRRSGNSRPLP